MSIKAFSFGGGVQSMAALVLAAQDLLPVDASGDTGWDAFLFANVGDRAEHPETLRYFSDVALPFARRHGIELIELRKKRRDGSEDDLLDAIERGIRSLPFPVRMSNGAPGNRACTADFKIKVIYRHLKRMGATEADPAIVGIGISMDEIQRAKGWGERDPRTPAQIREYPLLRLSIRRRDAFKVIADAGLPQPPRSACWFCPFHSLDEWRKLRREHPELFEQAVELERMLNRRRDELGKDHVWLTGFGRPLDSVVQDQLVLAVDDPGTAGAPCDTGHCFT